MSKSEIVHEGKKYESKVINGEMCFVPIKEPKKDVKFEVGGVYSWGTDVVLLTAPCNEPNTYTLVFISRVATGLGCIGLIDVSKNVMQNTLNSQCNYLYRIDKKFK